MSQDLLFEFIGTAVLILLGDGVVANVLLKGTKGHGSGWVVISIAWGLAVFVDKQPNTIMSNEKT